MNKKIVAAGLTLSMLLFGCGSKEETTETTTETTETSSTEMFTDRDYDTTYEDATGITLENNNSSCDSDAVKIDGNTITIKKEGSYILSGTLDEGQIVVDATDAKVQIVLDTVSITNSSSAALYVKDADKVFVTMVQYSYNHLNNTGTFVQSDDNTVDGAIFSKSDITFNGEGNLIIESTGNGIVSKDDLKVTSGTYDITSSSKGIEGKNSVRVADGKITINSQEDAIQSKNEENTKKGFIYILDGTFSLTSIQDGMDASNYIDIENGSISISANGGYANSSKTHTDGMPGDFGHNDFGSSYSEDDSVSCKGLKAENKITIKDGTITLDCADDTIHSDGSVSISGGKITATSGDDGIHAENTLTISNGEVSVNQSYEGIEATTINMKGGTTYVLASDDGFNAAGDTSSELNISGGRITVNAGGDGLDSNGSFTMSSGTVYINAPDNGGNGIIDYQTSGTISGGTLIGAGASGMNENFSDASIGCILTNLDSTQEAGTTITLADSKGNVLESYTTEKSYNSILICSPSISDSGTYTVTAGDQSLSFTMDGFINGSGNGMGGGMNMSQGNHNQGGIDMDRNENGSAF